ncbi:glycine betaine/proline transport system permease protein [Hasllibacter halocynthiae]|uniref:Glycine betaine/proline transport system permease protein n=1 Tax=Hasllibacter halocynthiae TaxID=595589 RepID=A0A2T0X2H9_9RHOB|nr:ABC transporter permease subunit [Hasllibacter halocynthiae]PRY93150.1 glycine betaine/proline transport system permease protein [Hasllibacter halocynthiae]
MAFYDRAFDALGLREWCDGGATGGPMTMAELLARSRGEAAGDAPFSLPFPSLDNLHDACGAIPRTRDFTAAIEDGFLAAKDAIKVVLDPLTQPLSWALDGALELFTWIPWWILIPLLVLATWGASKSRGVTLFVALSFLFLGFVDHLDVAIQTLAIIFVCTTLCVLLGVPVGIAMSKRRGLRGSLTPVLDLLQTLPTFVYLIPLIFLFSVTESKLYGIAIILYAIVPVIRLTDLGIRLVDPAVTEAADAFGMTPGQKLWKVELPLALPNIMAGINQTIMMSLAMVVIASLVSAPGLGVLVLRGIRNLELGVGLLAGVGIVLLAVMLDRASKAALERVDRSEGNA